MKIRMTKRTKIISAHVAVLLILLAGALFLIRDASHMFRGFAYDTGAPTRAKLAMMSRWVPPDSDLMLAVDVPMALANQPLGEKIETVARGKSGVAAELILALMANRDALGMIAVTGRIGGPGEESDAVIIAQGDFDEEKLVPAIRTAMAAGKAGLVAQNLGWATVYAESDSRDPFAFMILDRNHIAAGRRRSLAAFYEAKPEKGKEISCPADQVLTGYVAIGERMKKSTPKDLFLPEAAYISSPDGVDLTVTIPCGDPAKAQGVLMFLEGLRSLVSIQEGPSGESGLAAVARGFEMTATGGDVVLKGKLIPLVGLWAGQERPAEFELTLPEGQGLPQNPPAQKAR